MAEALVSVLDGQLQDETAPTLTMPLEVPQQIAGWMDRFLDGLQAATESEFRDVHTLNEAVAELCLLRQSVSLMQEHRPFGRAVVLAREMADEGVLMVRSYLDVLMGTTPLAAQRSAVTAQHRIDHLGELARELTTWLKQQQAISAASTAPESLRILLELSMKTKGATNLIDLARMGQQDVSRTLDITPNIGACLEYSFSETFADVLLDVDAFRAKVAKALKLLSVEILALDSMLREYTFHRDLARLRLEVFDGAVACQRAVTAGVPRQAARALVELNATLVECAGPLLGLPLLSALQRKSAPYEKSRHLNASEILRQAQGNPAISDLFEGLDHHLRTAQSHRAISYGDEAMETAIRSGTRTYGYEELIASTFAAVESVMAGFAALSLVADTSGIPTEQDSVFESLGFSVVDIAEFYLRSLGFNDSTAALEGACLIIHLAKGSPKGLTPVIAALLESKSIRTLVEFRLVLSDGASWWCTIDSYLTSRRATGPLERQVALLRIQASWHSPSGRRWLTTHALGKWTFHQVREALDLDTIDRFQGLRALRVLASEMGEPEVAAAVRGVVGWAQRDLLENAGAEDQLRAFAPFLQWVQSPEIFEPI